MNEVDFNNGFLCGMFATGLPLVTSGGGNNATLPEVTALDVISLEYYTNKFNYGRSNLNASTYTTILASSYNAVPKSGYVIIGGLDLHDFESDTWWEAAEADLRITVDGQVFYEGDVWQYLEGIMINPPRAFFYKNSFQIAAKRLNMTDAMEIELKYTMIVALK